MMSPESAPRLPNPGSIDPSLMGGQQLVGGLDPVIHALATAPDSLGDDVRRGALTEATRLAGFAERVIVSDEQGQPRWGKEWSKPTDVFTFNHELRGDFEDVPDNPADMNPAMALVSRKEGIHTHVIVETDDGQQVMIRKTNDETSASKQTFDLLATSRETGRAGKPAQRRELDTSMLKDVVVVPGERMTLGADPESGKPVITRGRVTKITAFDMTNDGLVPSSSRRLQQPELRSDAVQSFGETMRDARRSQAGAKLGSEAMADVELSSISQGEAAEGQDDSLGEIATVLRENDVDLSAANQRFEGDAQKFIQGLRETAQTEGRQLTDAENQQIKNVVSLINSQRTLAARMSAPETKVSKNADDEVDSGPFARQPVKGGLDPFGPRERERVRVPEPERQRER